MGNAAGEGGGRGGGVTVREGAECGLGTRVQVQEKRRGRVGSGKGGTDISTGLVTKKGGIMVREMGQGE